MFETAAVTIIRLATRINRAVGRAVAWLTVIMALVVFAVVVLRYGFSVGWVWLQESYVWMHGLVFMLAAGFTLLRDEHVRVDIFYRAAGPRYRAWVDLAGSLAFLVPFAAVLFVLSWPYAAESWARLESSREAGGLPGLFLLKSIIPLFCFLLFIQGLSGVARAGLILAGRTEHLPDEESAGPAVRA